MVGEGIESAIKRPIRYLLTLKGRPPFCLAGIEMYERLSEISANLEEMIAHLPTPCQGPKPSQPQTKD